MAENMIVKQRLDQIVQLFQELESWLNVSFLEFEKDIMRIRACQRNLEMLVEIAGEINLHLLEKRPLTSPESYRGSFLRLKQAGILPDSLAEALAESAELRNILVHEYDFDEDNEKFYHSAKKLAPSYQEYAKTIAEFLKKSL